MDAQHSRRVYTVSQQEQIMLRINWLFEMLFKALNANTPISREEAERITSALVEEIPKITPL